MARASRIYVEGRHDAELIAAVWGADRRIRSQVRDWTDLEPALIGRVEELIDFVTQPAGDE
ncbi:Protein of uncharacterised function (DUF3097) [Mycobacterium tuberculosis]|nr:Protein of uncharacterised function (DUF3097) [Mycobacterium tuberculosis]